MAEAEKLMRQEKYDEAIRKFEALNKAEGGACAECMLGLVQAYNGQRAFKDAMSTARRLIALSPDPRLQALAYNELGLAILLSGRRDPDNLHSAEEAFRKVLELGNDRQEAAYLNLAAVLLRLDKADEARSLLTEFVNKGTASEAMAEHARQILRNPRCAEEPCPTGVSFLTADGSRVALEDLRGRVVVISFWATWCRPCMESMPDLKRLHKRFEKEPFALVGVNVDADHETMARYVAQERLEWPQRWDDHSRLSREMFKVDRYPTEIIMDHEGVIVGRSHGWSSRTFDQFVRQVREAVSKAQKAQKRAQTSD